MIVTTTDQNGQMVTIEGRLETWRFSHEVEFALPRQYFLILENAEIPLEKLTHNQFKNLTTGEIIALSEVTLSPPTAR